jgi:hypothetical protein
MAEIVIENQICKACGADVRPEALFCYNCGGAVAEQIVKTESENGNNKTSDIWRRANSEEVFVEKTQIADSESEVREIEVAEKTKIENKKTEIFEEAKLKSAASMRRKAKSFQRKEVEIIWEEPENVSGVRLFLIALLLTAFAAAVVVFAMYLK